MNKKFTFLKASLRDNRLKRGVPHGSPWTLTQYGSVG